MHGSLGLLAQDNLNNYKVIKGDNLKSHERHASLCLPWEELLASSRVNTVISGFCPREVSTFEGTWLH